MMTIERRCVVGLGDIRAVTLECKKCGARLSLSPDAIEQHHLYRCASCRAEWLSDATGTGTLPKSELARFLVMLAPSRKSQLDGTDSAVQVRVLFEFDATAFEPYDRKASA